MCAEESRYELLGDAFKDGALLDHDAALSASKNRMDLICAKHRSGAIGEAQIGCDITTNRFWSLTETQAVRDF